MAARKKIPVEFRNEDVRDNDIDIRTAPQFLIDMFFEDVVGDDPKEFTAAERRKLMRFHDVDSFDIDLYYRAQVVKLTLADALAEHLWVPRVKKQGSYVELHLEQCDVEVMTYKDLKADIKRAMKLGGFVAQGKGLFPCRDHNKDGTPIFYVKRKNPGNDERDRMFSIVPRGTIKKPFLVVHGKL